MPSERWLDSTVGNTGRSRRRLLKEVLGAGLSAGALASMAGCTDEIERTDSTGDTPVRRSIASLQQSDPDDVIPTFKEAVWRMRNDVSQSDPRHWDNQVAIHGIVGDFNECEHGNWLFLPWHRAYLLYFEDICRDLTGNQDFALPFWNWAENRQIPDIFGQSHGTPPNVPTGTANNNPLYNSSRRPGRTPGGASMDQGTVGTTTLENDVLSDPNFLRAVGGGWRTSRRKGAGTGALESMHDYVHWWIGGDMMRGNSPNDPIFWTHHCFVDCVWWDWNARRGHSNPGDIDWYEGQEVGGPHTPTSPQPTPSLSGDFVDQAGNTVSDLSPLTTVLYPLNAYRYENVGKGSTTTPTPEGSGMLDDTDQLRSHLEEGANVDLEVVERFPVAEELEVRAREPLSIETNVPFGEVGELLDSEPRDGGVGAGRFLLTAKDILPPEQPEFITRVFVNRPEAVEEPVLDDPHFAGNVTFFEPGAHHPNQNLLVSLNDTLELLFREQLVDPEEPVSLQLVPDASRGASVEGAYRIGAFDLDFTRSVVRPIEDQEGDRTEEGDQTEESDPTEAGTPTEEQSVRQQFEVPGQSSEDGSSE